MKPRSKSTIGKHARNKGKVAEREWVNWLKERGMEARRGQQFAGGPDSPDVIGGFVGTHCEVKRREVLNIHDAITLAATEAKPGTVPYVAHRRNGKPWLITIKADDVFAFASSVMVTPTGRKNGGEA